MLFRRPLLCDQEGVGGQFRVLPQRAQQLWAESVGQVHGEETQHRVAPGVQADPGERPGEGGSGGVPAALRRDPSGQLRTGLIGPVLVEQ
ncbi:hypothetical protein [Streptomyces sp. NPDC005181]|uniref:hypothetical protein n=1 Tax=Streptomyces sp. NPDC005181 TaxID=3156869 RepID=UPI0033A324D0